MKRVYSLLCLLLCLLLWNGICTAQKNFIPGVIYESNNDSVAGFINFVDWELNPKIITFKKDQQAPEQSFNATQIKGFRVKEYRYIASIAGVDKTPHHLTEEHLLVENKNYQVTDTIFLKVVYLGVANLYYLKDADFKPHYYIEVQPEGLIELSNRIVLVKNKHEDNQYAKKSDKYKKELNYYLGKDCPEIKKLADAANYDEASFVKVLKVYNSCKTPTIGTAINQGNTIKTNQFGFLAGLSKNYLFSQYHFTDKNTGKAITPKFTPINSLVLGIQFNHTLPFHKGSWNIYSDIILKNTVFKTSFINYQYTPDYYGKMFIRLKSISSRINVQLRYLYPGEKLKPFISIGPGFTLNVINSSEVIQYDHFKTDVSKRLVETYSRKAFSAGVLGGAGVQYHQFSLELRAEFSDGAYLHTKNRSYYLLLGYKLQ